MATRPEFTASPAQSIPFSVNGKPVVVSSAPTERLSRVLREELGLTGTKVGCDAGDCGACSVLVDGKVRRSCTLRAFRCMGQGQEL